MSTISFRVNERRFSLCFLRQVLIVPAFVTALVLTARTSDDVCRFKRAASFGQILEEEDCALAFLAGADDIPLACPRLDHFEGPFWRRFLGFGRLRTQTTVSVFMLRTSP